MLIELLGRLDGDVDWVVEVIVVVMAKKGNTLKIRVIGGNEASSLVYLLSGISSATHIFNHAYL